MSKTISSVIYLLVLLIVDISHVEWLIGGMLNDKAIAHAVSHETLSAPN